MLLFLAFIPSQIGTFLGHNNPSKIIIFADMTQRLYLSLGANLGDRTVSLQKALQLLSNNLGVEVVRSSFIETRPWGYDSDNLFLNAVAIFDTELSPLEALQVTQTVEQELGRTEKTIETYTDRLIDIDLLFYEGEEGFEDDRLTLPHPQMARRRFVLEPLAEIAPEIVVPKLRQNVRTLLSALNTRTTIHRMEKPSPRYIDALQHLLPQLTGQPTLFSEAELLRLYNNKETEVFFLADEDDCLLGTCSLCYATSPTGTKACLEDVVVDATAQGRGYATRLVKYAINRAKERGAKSVDLTSSPFRIAANHLYRKLGFSLRETNVYRLEL